MNNVVVTVLHLLRALHQRIIVYRIGPIVKNATHTSESIATAIYDNKQSDCLLSRSQGLIWLKGTRHKQNSLSGNTLFNYMPTYTRSQKKS